MNLKAATSAHLTHFTESLKSALAIDLPYGTRWLNEVSSPVPAAVLILFGCASHEKLNITSKNASVLVIRRAETVETHKGQMAFPGGICDQNDCNEPHITALRETEEEVGISRSDVNVLGMLPSLITTTAFSIIPIVGVLKKPLDETSLNLNQDEIAEAFWIPIEELRSEKTYRKEFINFGSEEFQVDVFQFKQYRIWGATGAMLKNMLDRLARLEKGEIH